MTDATSDDDLLAESSESSDLAQMLGAPKPVACDGQNQLSTASQPARDLERCL